MNATIEIKNKDGGIQITATNLPVSLSKRNGKFIAFCPVLKSLGYSSNSEDEAITDLFNSLDGFFRIHLKNNTLDKALTSFEWQQQMDLRLAVTSSYEPSFSLKDNNPIYKSLRKESHTFELAA